MQAIGDIISYFSPYYFNCHAKKCTKIQLEENILYFFSQCLYFFPFRPCNNFSTLTDCVLGGKMQISEGGNKYPFSTKIQTPALNTIPPATLPPPALATSPPREGGSSNNQEEEVTTSRAPVEAPVEGRTDSDKEGKFLIVHSLWVSPPRPFYFWSLTPPPSQ